MLTPASPSATLSTGDWWLGATGFKPDRVADSDPWDFPVLDISHACPSTPAGATRTADVGYGLSVSALSQFAEDATGIPGIANLLTDVEEDTWDVYAVRVARFTPPPPADDIYRLQIELRGTQSWFYLPLKMEDTDEWSFDLSRNDYAAEGTVTRDEDSLTITVTAGALHHEAGDLTLDEASIVLPLLATD